MPYSHLLAHTLAHHLSARFIPDEHIRLVLLGLASIALLILWLYFRNENAWRAFEIACAPVIEALCHIGAHAGATEAVAHEAAEVIENA